MKPVVRVLYLVSIVLVFAAACGPIGTATATPVPTPPPLYKSATNLHVGNGVLPAPGCTPPQPKVSGVSSYCADPSKHLGGVTYSDYTDLTTDGTTSWLEGDSIPAGVTCNLDEGTSTATCSGPAGATIQAMVCSSCSIPNAAPSDFVCPPGFAPPPGGGACDPTDPKTYPQNQFCPTGSLYDNGLQNCVDTKTHKVVNPCPPDHPIFSPGDHRCYAKPQSVYDCETFPVKLGVCIQLQPIPLEVVPFCLNNKTNEGAANITIPKGALLKVDVQANHLDSCTLGQPKADGSRVLTCLGPSAQSFGGTACSDPSNPATCQTVKETLGECAGTGKPSDNLSGSPSQPQGQPKPPCQPSILAPNCP